MSSARYLRYMPNGLPGGGPWHILPECPAQVHNTAFAAKKGAKARRGKDCDIRVKCICPRALARLEEIKASARRNDALQRPDRSAEQPHPGRPKGSEGIPQYVRNVRQGIERPELHKGECGTPVGLMIMDLASDSRWSGEALAAAKSLCWRCPIKFECGQWAAQAEQPAGAWVGIYGGLTHMERRKAAKGGGEAA